MKRAPEPYVSSALSKCQRSVYAQFRAGILPLAIERGRFSNVALTDRVCLLCNTRDIEDEFHFLCVCTRYSFIRKKLYEKAQLICEGFNNMDDFDKFVCLNSDCQIITAKFVYEAFIVRKCILYNGI